MNETNKLNKVKEARELGLNMMTFNGRKGQITQVTEFHIQKTMNQSTWIGSMNCGKRVALENSIDWYDLVIEKAELEIAKEVKIIDLVCTDCLEKI